jgi:hypothetical protein
VAGLNTRLTPSNAAAVLLRQQYTTAQANSISTAQRHDFLQAALQAAFGQLTTGSLPDPETLATTLAPMAHQGRLLFWSSHPADQPLLARLGLEGSFPQPGPASDVLAVTVANAANNKIDAFLRELFGRAPRLIGAGQAERRQPHRYREEGQDRVINAAPKYGDVVKGGLGTECVAGPDGDNRGEDVGADQGGDIAGSP